MRRFPLHKFDFLNKMKAGKLHACSSGIMPPDVILEGCDYLLMYIQYDRILYYHTRENAMVSVGGPIKPSYTQVKSPVSRETLK